MNTPPILTAQQREAALLKAKQSRARRAEVKGLVKSGDLGIKEVIELASSDEAVSKMRVLELLEALSGVGKVRAGATLDRFSISRTRRIQGLGARQRRDLIEEFSLSANEIHSGSLVVLSGPGGVGKSTVSAEIRKRPDFWVSISATTRKPRHNELEDPHYIFMSNEEFDIAIAKDYFLEWASFAGARYGTPKAPVLESLANGKDVLLEIDIEGAKQVKANWDSAILVFLEPPTWEDLVSRLEGRATDTPERRAQRLALAQEEMAQSPFFDHILVNDEVDKVVASLIRLAHT